jgi:hypothetical protein
MRLFVGSYGQLDQELKFIQHLKQNSSGELRVMFLRPKDQIFRAWVNKFCNCPYEAYKFAIPHLCNFKGRAVYLDVACEVRADLNEILELPSESALVSAVGYRPEVQIFNCHLFGDWPSFKELETCGWKESNYYSLLGDRALFGKYPVWNAADEMNGEAKIIRSRIPFRTRWQP